MENLPSIDKRLSVQQSHEEIDHFNSAAESVGFPKMNEYASLAEVQTAEDMLEKDNLYKSTARSEVHEVTVIEQDSKEVREFCRKLEILLSETQIAECVFGNHKYGTSFGAPNMSPEINVTLKNKELFRSKSKLSEEDMLANAYENETDPEVLETRLKLISNQFLKTFSSSRLYLSKSGTSEPWNPNEQFISKFKRLIEPHIKLWVIKNAPAEQLNLPRIELQENFRQKNSEVIDALAEKVLSLMPQFQLRKAEDIYYVMTGLEVSDALGLGKTVNDNIVPVATKGELSQKFGIVDPDMTKMFFKPSKIRPDVNTIWVLDSDITTEKQPTEEDKLFLEHIKEIKEQQAIQPFPATKDSETTERRPDWKGY